MSNEIAILHPSFEKFALMCMECDELVQNFNRLKNANLSFKPRHRSPIDLLIDAACGNIGISNKMADVDAFMEFVRDIFLRSPEVKKQFDDLFCSLASGDFK